MELDNIGTFINGVDQKDVPQAYVDSLMEVVVDRVSEKHDRMRTIRNKQQREPSILTQVEVPNSTGEKKRKEDNSERSKRRGNSTLSTPSLCRAFQRDGHRQNLQWNYVLWQSHWMP